MFFFCFFWLTRDWNYALLLQKHVAPTTGPPRKPQCKFLLIEEYKLINSHLILYIIHFRSIWSVFKLWLWNTSYQPTKRSNSSRLLKGYYGTYSTVDCLFNAHPLPLEHILSLLAVSYVFFHLLLLKICKESYI